MRFGKIILMHSVMAPRSLGPGETEPPLLDNLVGHAPLAVMAGLDGPPQTELAFRAVRVDHPAAKGHDKRIFAWFVGSRAWPRVDRAA